MLMSSEGAMQVMKSVEEPKGKTLIQAPFINSI